MVNETFKGHRILVTGGAGDGVGSGVCEVLHSRGAQLIINDVDQKKLDEARERYRNALLIRANLESPLEVDRMFSQIREFCGAADGLVNNAGIGLSKPAHEATEDEFMHLFGVNVHAVWRVSRTFVNECIRNNERGNIVNISSVHAFATQPRYAIYSAAKNAVLGLTRGMACELGPLGFRVNAVGPGYVHAQQNYDLIKTWSDNPEQWVKDFMENHQVLGHEIKATDIGKTVAFLLSEEAACITGQNIYVDNGTTCLLFNRNFT